MGSPERCIRWIENWRFNGNDDVDIVVDRNEPPSKKGRPVRHNQRDISVTDLGLSTFVSASLQGAFHHKPTIVRLFRSCRLLCGFNKAVRRNKVRLDPLPDEFVSDDTGQ